MPQRAGKTALGFIGSSWRPSADAWTLMSFFQNERDRIDFIAMESRGARLPRLIMAVVVALLCGSSLGWPQMMGWLVAGVLNESYGALASRGYLKGRSDGRQRAFYLSAVLSGSILWTVLLIMLWTKGRDDLRLVAMCLIAGQLVHAESVSFRSRVIFAIDAGAPALTFLALLALRSDLEGQALVMALAGAAAMLVYVLVGARANARRVQALEAAQRQALQASAAKTRFIATVSHELRTPLNGVLGLARILLRRAKAVQDRADLSTLVRCGEGMTSLLNDLLDTAKIEAGKLELDPVTFDVRALAQDMRALWEPTANAKNLSFSVQVAEDAPSWVCSDPMRLKQIMSNLVSNALKFTPSGGVSILIDIKPLAGETNAAELLFEVRDTGIGIEPHDLARLFEDYSQADRSIARRFGGTGLGLSISRQLMALLGGAIRVESQVGRGSTFFCRAPVLIVEPPADQNCAETFDLNAVRLLVVDDNPVNRRIAAAILGACGARIDEAENGQACLAKLSGRAPFDLVLMDVHMPGLSGIETLSRIRADQAGRPDILVVALTADVMPGDKEALLACGFDDVQSKPIDPAALLTCLERRLAGRRLMA